MFSELASGVFSVNHDTAEGKNGIIVGSQGAVAIDTGLHPEEGDRMAEFISTHGYHPEYLILTHGHSDHIFGSKAFQEAEVFAHFLTPTVIAKQIYVQAKRTGIDAAELRASIAQPTVSFVEDMRLNLGDKHVCLFHSPGHSSDSVCVYVEEDRVLFAGDTVVTGIVPALWDGDSRQMEHSLWTLASMDIEVLVPGHGPVLRGADVVHEWILWLIDYLVTIRESVIMSLEQGYDPESAVNAASFREFAAGRLPENKHNMIRRHRDTVRNIVEEELQRIQPQPVSSATYARMAPTGHQVRVS
ncbi:MAG: MBL fold metallo-hydrolase [Chloroflexota bacterium]